VEDEYNERLNKVWTKEGTEEIQEERRKFKRK
jgi:hypothetical protein